MTIDANFFFSGFLFKTPMKIFQLFMNYAYTYLYNARSFFFFFWLDKAVYILLRKLLNNTIRCFRMQTDERTWQECVCFTLYQRTHQRVACTGEAEREEEE